MNRNWQRITKSIEKPERLIVGLMSGTSLDGLDIALCAISGSGLQTNVKLVQFSTLSYEKSIKDEIKAIFSKRDTDLQMICLMNEKIALLHADLILKALDKWKIKPEEIDVIASHGQTIYHAPKSLHRLAGYPNGTLQIGDGDHIAVKTGIITICDFRQKHIAAGGEGAPLAVYGDYLLFSKQGENRIMLNIGGIANFTYLSGDGDAGKMFSTDVGPGNTIMDQFIQKNYSGLYFDEGGRLAMDGTVNEKLLSALLDLEFFNANFPKTTGPELFNLTYLEKAQAKSNTADISNEDVMATLNRFTGQVIVNAISVATKGNTDNPVAVYLSGGGMHNSVLCSFLKGSLPEVQFYTTADLGIEPDAKEAVLFALLANETLVGEGIGFGNGEDVPAVNMGKICFPY